MRGMLRRVGAWVAGRARAFGAWLRSARGRVAWTRLLAGVLVVVLSPWLTVLWRMLLGYGDAVGQMLVLTGLLLVAVWLDARRARRRLDEHEGRREARPKRSRKGGRRA